MSAFYSNRLYMYNLSASPLNPFILFSSLNQKFWEFAFHVFPVKWLTFCSGSLPLHVSPDLSWSFVLQHQKILEKTVSSRPKPFRNWMTHNGSRFPLSSIDRSAGADYRLKTWLLCIIQKRSTAYDCIVWHRECKKDAQCSPDGSSLSMHGKCRVNKREIARRFHFIGGDQFFINYLSGVFRIVFPSNNEVTLSMP